MKKDMFKTKAFRVGGYSVFAAILVIAICICAMFITDSLPARFTKIDITTQNLFGVSEDTKELIGSLDEEVTIYVITRSGVENTLLSNVLANYEGISDKLNIVVKDPVIDPTFANNYTKEKVSLNSIVVECGEKSRYLPYEDLFSEEMNADYSTSTSFIGESKINAAIKAVTEGKETVLYAVTGHGETVIADTVLDSIENNNIVVENVNLLSQSTDLSNASCVLIYEPKQDFSQNDIDILTAYMQNGGNIIVYTGLEGMVLHNFNQFMSTYGVSADSNVVLEGDSRNILNGQPFYVLPQFGDHDITKPLLERNYFVLTALSHPIDIAQGAEVSQVLTTTDKGYRVALKDNGEFDEESAIGPEEITLGVSINSGDGQIVWYSATSMLESQMGANIDLLLNSINWMCEREDVVTVHAKSLDVEYLTVNTLAARMLNVLFIFIIPVAIIAFGVVVWVKRRRK